MNKVRKVIAEKELNFLAIAKKFNYILTKNFNLHLNNIFKDGELREESVVKEFLTTTGDGKNKELHPGRYLELGIFFKN